MNIISLTDNKNKLLGEKVTLIFEDKEYTNTMLDEMGRRLAAGLKSLGIGRGDHVAVSLPNSPEVMAIFGAIWRIGAVVVPIMFLLGEEEMKFILNHSDAKTVITDQELIDKMETAMKGIDGIKNVIVLGQDSKEQWIDFNQLVSQSPIEDKTEDMAEDDVALMIYTSGTTGRPKGVMLTHNNLYSNAIANRDITPKDKDLNKKTVSILCLPLAHSFGVVAMNAGAASKFMNGFYVLMRWFDPEEIFRLIEKYGVTGFAGVPTMYQMLYSHPSAEKYDTSSLETCVISAAPVTEELYNSFSAKFNCQMIEGYGLTEAAPSVALAREDMPWKKGSCGIPYPGVEVKIFDYDDKELPTGEQGEIVVRGPNVMKGYYKNPDETALALRGGWLHTGDIGYMDEEGYLYITDRKKDMIIKGGYNVYPSEIESYIVEHPAVMEAAVIGIPHEKYGEDIMAFVAPVPGQTLLEEELTDYVQTRLTKFKCPTIIKIVEALPKNLVGKIQKTALREMV